MHSSLIPTPSMSCRIRFLPGAWAFRHMALDWRNRLRVSGAMAGKRSVFSPRLSSLANKGFRWWDGAQALRTSWAWALRLSRKRLSKPGPCLTRRLLPPQRFAQTWYKQNGVWCRYLIPRRDFRQCSRIVTLLPFLSPAILPRKQTVTDFLVAGAWKNWRSRSHRAP